MPKQHETKTRYGLRRPNGTIMWDIAFFEGHPPLDLQDIARMPDRQLELARLLSHIAEEAGVPTEYFVKSHEVISQTITTVYEQPVVVVVPVVAK